MHQFSSFICGASIRHYIVHQLYGKQNCRASSSQLWVKLGQNQCQINQQLKPLQVFSEPTLLVGFLRVFFTYRGPPTQHVVRWDRPTLIDNLCLSLLMYVSGAHDASSLPKWITNVLLNVWMWNVRQLKVVTRTAALYTP
jgi:hypothetical protein